MNGQRGQALPLAIIALAIGSLVVAPFLGYAGTDLIGSRVYGEAIKEQSAADAGIEHAVWSLVNGDLAGQLSQPGDEMTYQLDETINGLNVNITVTANATGGTAGEITDTVIDTLEFDTANGYEPSMINITGDIYAIAYRGPGSDGFLKTITIDGEGEIGNSTIDTLEFDGSAGYEPCVIHITGDVYAIAYRGPGNDGFLKTVTINTNGGIGNSAIDTLEFDGSDGYEPSIIYVSGNVYAIAYRGAGNDGFLKTVYIDADGHIDNPAIDILEFDNSNGYAPFLINVAGDTYGIAYRGTSAAGFAKTVTIADDGNIAGAVIDSATFDSPGYEPCIINVSGDMFAIVYRGPDDDGFLETISITSDGDIGAVADALQLDTSSYDPVIISVTDGICAIAYRGPGSDGFVKTAGINATGGAATYEIQAAAGGTMIRAVVSIDNGVATIISWQVE